jgi:hypothetical protein
MPINVTDSRDAFSNDLLRNCLCLFDRSEIDISTRIICGYHHGGVMPIPRSLDYYLYAHGRIQNIANVNQAWPAIELQPVHKKGDPE